MIHRKHCISLLELAWYKRGVGGQWPDEMHSPLPQCAECRFDDVDFLAAQVATFTGMGIQAADNNPGFWHAEFRHQVMMQDAYYLIQQLATDLIADIA